MNNQSSGFSWALKRSFYFESSFSLEQVVRSLEYLEEEERWFSASHNDISIARMSNEYVFCYRIRQGNKGNYYTRAFGEGQVWQAANGKVMIEGQAQIEPWRMYGSFGAVMLIPVLGMAVLNLLSFFPIAFLTMAAIMFFQYYSDRNRVVDRIGEAVANTSNMTDILHSEKDEQSAPVKWNNAISEYDSQQKQ